MEVLSGSVTVAKAPRIDSVRPSPHFCSPDVSPSGCEGRGSGHTLTRRRLDPPVEVNANQQVDMEVIVGFQ